VESPEFRPDAADYQSPDLGGDCDLCYLKGAKQVYSINASDRNKAECWARMERTAVSSTSVTGDGALFRFDRPSYQQILD
jgi:hypothetical protein